MPFVKTLAVLFMSLFLPVSCLAKTILPDACGNEKTTFDVSTRTPETSIAPPATGMGQIVFIQTMDRVGGFLGNETTRFGVDGNWAGANHGNSYFVFDVPAGEHHLCVNWQKKKDVSVLALNVEAGKTYYYEAKIIEHRKGGYGNAGGQPVHVSTLEKGFDAAILSEDEGKFRVKASKLSTWK